MQSSDAKINVQRVSPLRAARAARDRKRASLSTALMQKNLRQLRCSAASVALSNRFADQPQRNEWWISVWPVEFEVVEGSGGAAIKVVEPERGAVRKAVLGVLQRFEGPLPASFIAQECGHKKSSVRVACLRMANEQKIIKVGMFYLLPPSRRRGVETP